MKYYHLILGLAICIFFSCEKSEYGLDGDLPDAPMFSLEQDPENPNKYIVTDLSQGNFTRLWDFTKDGKPKTSKLESDTVLFTKKGNYDITLHISANDGNGTAFSKQNIEVLDDAVISCTETLALLTNDCTTKCWKFSLADGAVQVGPAPLSGEWFTSGTLEATQYDDRFCFDNEFQLYDYQNQGSSLSACQGYIEVVDYPIPTGAQFEYLPESGLDGTDRITLLNELSWMGVEDSGNTYDIFEITEDALTLITPIKPCDGAPSPGWFTLSFVKAE